MDDWPFADPPNVVSITVRQVVDRGEPILLVAHDAEDGGWQFLTPFLSPDESLISTSYAERQNLNIRMQNRRFTRLTNAFPKKAEMLAYRPTTSPSRSAITTSSGFTRP